MGGLGFCVNVSLLTVSGLAFQDAPDIVRLPLTDHELQTVAQCEHPAVAGKRADLADVIDVYNSVPMHALKEERLKTVLQCAKSLARHETPFACQNPNQLALGLKRQHFISIQQVIFTARATD